MTINLPTTKQTRRMFSSAMKRHGVEVIKSKTRDKVNLSGIDYDLWSYVFKDIELRQRMRTVEFHVSFNEIDNLVNAMEEFESMLVLSGKYHDNRKTWKYRYGSNYKIIKILSVIE